MVPFCRNSRVLKNAFMFLSVFQQLSYLRDNSRMSQLIQITILRVAARGAVLSLPGVCCPPMVYLGRCNGYKHMNTWKSTLASRQPQVLHRQGGLNEALPQQSFGFWGMASPSIIVIRALKWFKFGPISHLYQKYLFANEVTDYCSFEISFVMKFRTQVSRITMHCLNELFTMWRVFLPLQSTSVFPSLELTSPMANYYYFFYISKYLAKCYR